MPYKKAGVFSLFKKNLSGVKGKNSNFCASWTTLCRQKIKICLQNFFLENVCLSTKFYLSLKKKRKNFWGNFNFTWKFF